MVSRWYVKFTEDSRKQMMMFYEHVINKNVQLFHRFMVRSHIALNNETMP